MHKKTLLGILCIAIFAFMAFMISPSVQSPDPFQWPRLDTLRFVIKYPIETAVTAMEDGVIDNIVGIITPEALEAVEGFDWVDITSDKGFHLCYIGINCRDVYPDTAGKWYDYHGRMPGDSNYPLNCSEFRYALSRICDIDPELEPIYGPINTRAYTPVPAALGEWHNPNAPPPDKRTQDLNEAYTVLTDAGWSNSTGDWMTPTGVELRQIWVIAPTEAPPTCQFTSAMIDDWNAFFGTNSVGADYFLEDYMSFYPEIDVTFYDRDHDIYMLCWGLGADPDYLYYFFHPDTDVEGGSNSPGLDYEPLNDALWQLYYGTNKTTKEPLTHTQMVEQAWDAQQHIFELAPYIPIYHRTYYAGWDKELTGYPIDSAGYGAYGYQTDFPFSNIEWTGSKAGKTDMNFHLGGPIDTLNPAFAGSVYEVTILGRVYDSLITTSPRTKEKLPWAGTGWQEEPWADPANGVTAGKKITFYLRNDVYWHCGEQATSEDVKFAWDLVKENQVGEYYSTWEKLIKTETEGPYIAKCYLNTTSPWVLLDMAGAAFDFPKHIYEPYFGHPAELQAFHPWEERHPGWEGAPETWPAEWPHSFPLTKLCGTGNYVFDHFDKAADVVYLERAKPWGTYKHFLNGPPVIVSTHMAEVAPPANGYTTSANGWINVLHLDDSDTTVQLTVKLDGTTVATYNNVDLGACGAGVKKLDAFDDSPLPIPWSDFKGSHTLKVEYTSTGSGSGSYSYSFTVNTMLLGDINRDNTVNVADATILAKHWGKDPKETYHSADVNGDGDIDVADATILILNWGGSPS